MDFPDVPDRVELEGGEGIEKQVLLQLVLVLELVMEACHCPPYASIAKCASES